MTNIPLAPRSSTQPVVVITGVVYSLLGAILAGGGAAWLSCAASGVKGSAAAIRKAIRSWFAVRNAVSLANSATAQGTSKMLGMTSGSAVARENRVFSLDVFLITLSTYG